MRLGPVRIEAVGETFPWCHVWVAGVRIHHWYVGAILVAHDHRDLIDQGRRVASALTHQRRTA